MGLNKKSVRYVIMMFGICGFPDLNKVRICELGNTRIRHGANSYIKKLTKKRFETAKLFFEYLGAEDVSIDLNGKDGALVIDLSNPVDVKALGGQFDIVLNAGTAEHVENQAILFKNIYNLCKQGGILISMVPPLGSKHGLYQYDTEFFILDDKWKIIDLAITNSVFNPRRKHNNLSMIYCTQWKR